MDLQLKKHNRWVIIDLNGRVDSFNYEIIKEKVNTLVNMGNRFLAFNLEGVQFIALPNLRYLIQIGKILNKKGGQTAIVGTSQDILEHFEQIRGLESICSFSSESELTSSDGGQA